MITEVELRPLTTKHTKGKSSLINAGRNSVFSEVNVLQHIDKGRRVSARIRQLESDMQSELRSIKVSKSKRLDLPPIPSRSNGKVGVEYETVNDGVSSRRKLFVECSN